MAEKFEQTLQGWRCVACGSERVTVTGDDETSAVTVIGDDEIERVIERVTCTVVGYQCADCGATDADAL